MVSRSTPRPRWRRSRCSTRRRPPGSQAEISSPACGAGLEVRYEERRMLLLGRGRRGVVVLGFRIEELAGGGERFGGGVLIFLTARDVFAAVDAFGFIGAACPGDAD